ncbi:hypothetical protein VOLCADRAFT_116796 [Volvox carteri f. nagariensis]|uniref:SH2 domain-containing protein n=1 Tax=Volvox carteri f. nagariensis TaxID=3068 RepID=D8TPH0_VOLCA|nr:uncharacterized protein VOLCADRAFT_116796 [Volvox carteri f. nagariensis]EFJ50616.1 hypothetical protein VOLCADRAFT_116796 [Volvox carteri f. nagariensis]|eukprot:XP_002948209.1 hypothetical protein VOLCADRAFT_116796 [Volvox carteri f. nagariensis]
MGTGLGPAWFSQEFPGLAARREPFPDVDRWQTTYVRYSSSETAQARGWNAECCRRNLHSLGVNDHPILRQHNLPDAINMRIIEAPAEFALPVKQDRRLLPCFKVRLEVQHHGALWLPVTLRAHVLSQQDKEQITSWLPPDDINGRDDKVQAAANGETRAVGIGGKDGQSLPQSANGGSTALVYSSSLRSTDRLSVKLEPSSFSFSGDAAGGGAGGGGAGGVSSSFNPDGLGGNSSAGVRTLSGLQPDQHNVLEPYGLMESAGLTVNGMIRDMGPAGRQHGLTSGGSAAAAGRDPIGPLNSLFAANRPDPVVTLASSGRMSSTGNGLAMAGNGARLGTGEPRDSFDVTVEMLMQQQQPLQYPLQRRSSPIHGGGALEAPAAPAGGIGGQLIHEMQRQLQQRQEEQSQRQQHERTSGNADGCGSDTASVVLQGGSNIIAAVQDFEFTNLEFLKPTRMNKVYIAFTASILDTDLLFVVFNVPTIGICRAEQREKACKKLHIDYRLLSHFDQGAGDRLDRDRLDVMAAVGGGHNGSGGTASSPFLTSSDGGLRGQTLESNPLPPAQGGRYAPPPAPGRMPVQAGKGPPQTQQLSPLQQQQQQQHHQHHHSGSMGQELQGFPAGQQLQQQQPCPSPSPPSGVSVGLSLGPGGGGSGGIMKFGVMPTRHSSDRLPGQHLSTESDYPRMPSGLDLHPNSQQQQQQHPQQQQRLVEVCVGMVGGPGLQAGGMGNVGGGGGGFPGPQGMLGVGGSGSLTGGFLSPHPSLSGPAGMMPSGGVMDLNGMAGNGGAGGGGGGPMAGSSGGTLGGRMMPGNMTFGMGHGGGMACDLRGTGGPDFFFGASGISGGGGGLGSGMSGGGAAMSAGGGNGLPMNGGMSGMGPGGFGPAAHGGIELNMLCMGNNSRKRDQGPKDDDNYRFQPVQPHELPPYQGFMGLTSSDVDMLLPAPHSRMAMRDFINEVYDSTGLHRRLTHMDMQALLSQAGFPMDSNREHDTISPQQWDEFSSQFRSIVNTLQQVASVWTLEDPVVISGFDMDRAGTITALANEPAGTFICRFSMSQPGCLVLTCKVGTAHPKADAMGLIHAIIKIDDLHERRVDTWIRDYAGATHLLDVYRQKRVDKRKVFATNYTRLRGLDVGDEQSSQARLGQGFM